MDCIALAAGLIRVAQELDADSCWLYEGRFHFLLGDGWSFALSQDSADRFRLEACLGGRPRDTLWCLSEDHERLAALVAELSNQLV